MNNFFIPCLVHHCILHTQHRVGSKWKFIKWMIIVLSWTLEMIVSQLYGSLTLFGLVFVSHLKNRPGSWTKRFFPAESLDSNPLLTESLPDCGKYERKEPLLNVKFHPLSRKTAQKRGGAHWCQRGSFPGEGAISQKRSQRHTVWKAREFMGTEDKERGEETGSIFFTLSENLVL